MSQPSAAASSSEAAAAVTPAAPSQKQAPSTPGPAACIPTPSSPALRRSSRTRKPTKRYSAAQQPAQRDAAASPAQKTAKTAQKKPAAQQPAASAAKGASTRRNKEGWTDEELDAILRAMRAQLGRDAWPSSQSEWDRVHEHWLSICVSTNGQASRSSVALLRAARRAAETDSRFAKLKKKHDQRRPQDSEDEDSDINAPAATALKPQARPSAGIKQAATTSSSTIAAIDSSSWTLTEDKLALRLFLHPKVKNKKGFDAAATAVVERWEPHVDSVVYKMRSAAGLRKRIKEIAQDRRHPQRKEACEITSLFGLSAPLTDDEGQRASNSQHSKKAEMDTEGSRAHVKASVAPTATTGTSSASRGLQPPARRSASKQPVPNPLPTPSSTKRTRPHAAASTPRRTADMPAARTPSASSLSSAPPSAAPPLLSESIKASRKQPDSSEWASISADLEKTMEVLRKSAQQDGVRAGRGTSRRGAESEGVNGAGRFQPPLASTSSVHSTADIGQRQERDAILRRLVALEEQQHEFGRTAAEAWDAMATDQLQYQTGVQELQQMVVQLNSTVSGLTGTVTRLNREMEQLRERDGEKEAVLDDLRNSLRTLQSEVQVAVARDGTSEGQLGGGEREYGGLPAYSSDAYAADAYTHSERDWRSVRFQGRDQAERYDEERYSSRVEYVDEHHAFSYSQRPASPLHSTTPRYKPSTPRYRPMTPRYRPSTPVYCPSTPVYHPLSPRHREDRSDRQSRPSTPHQSRKLREASKQYDVRTKDEEERSRAKRRRIEEPDRDRQKGGSSSWQYQ